MIPHLYTFECGSNFATSFDTLAKFRLQRTRLYELVYCLAVETIQEHTDFMWSNKHLSAIPKAKIDEYGNEIVEVGAHRKGIVEELEKAHIYISQLEERLFKLEKYINKND